MKLLITSQSSCIDKFAGCSIHQPIWFGRYQDKQERPNISKPCLDTFPTADVDEFESILLDARERKVTHNGFLSEHISVWNRQVVREELKAISTISIRSLLKNLISDGKINNLIW
jgi:hypothetical protein